MREDFLAWSATLVVFVVLEQEHTDRTISEQLEILQSWNVDPFFFLNLLEP